MGHVAVTASGDAGYYQAHAERDLAQADAIGGYYAKGDGGEPAPFFLGRGLEALGIEHAPAAERADELLLTTWSNLVHPSTGEVLGTAPRQYAGQAENLAKIAMREGVTLPAHLHAESVRMNNVTLREVQAAVASVLTPEEAITMTAKAAAEQRQNRTLYDITFSADKSVSVAHVGAERMGNDAAAEAFERALAVPAEAMAEYVTNELGASRIGYHGKAVNGVTTGLRVRNTGLAFAVAAHHTSREGDPQDHAHVLLLNRGLDETGKWHALDGQALYFARPSISVVGSRAHELYLSNTLGVTWESAGDGQRRIAAVGQEVCDLFSKRRAVIEVELERWAEKVRDTNGREPTAKERAVKSQQIARQTRAAKQHIERDVALERYGDEADVRGESLDSMWEDVERAVEAGRVGVTRGAGPTGDYDAEAVVDTALDALRAKGHTVWNRHHLYAAIDAALPDNWPQGMTAERLHGITKNLTRGALQREGLLSLTPEQPLNRNVPASMADADGFSMYLPRGREVYADKVSLTAEAELLLAAHRMDAPALSIEEAARVTAEAGLTEDQADVMVAVLSSGRSVEALIGPAGTGKSYTLAKLAKNWEGAAGEGATVVGLTVSENAAGVLRSEGFAAATNLTKWSNAQERIAKAQRAGRPVRDYDAPFIVHRGQLVVVDEASMAATADIMHVVELVEAQGGKVLLTGDNRQLDAVKDGGAMSLIVGERSLVDAGAIHTLKTVRRFREADGSLREWEAAASLALRDGAVSALKTYHREGAIVGGERDEVVQEAVGEAVAAHLTGRSSILSVGTAEQAAAVSSLIRNELLAAGWVSEDDHAVKLGNGCFASTGDLIQARKNDAKIKDERGQAVSNRDVLRVVAVTDAGSVIAVRQREDGGDGATLRLPPAYAAEYVDLAYASTIAAAQGRTVDVAATIIDPAQEHLEASHLYVGATRGRSSNRMYVVSAGERDVVDVLADVVRADASTESVTQVKRNEDEAAVSLARVGPVWAEAMNRLAADAYASTVRPVLENAGLLEALEADEARGAFWQQVAASDAKGYDPAELVRSTLAGREVELTGRSVAQVLHYRLREQAHMAWPVPCSGSRGVASVGDSYLERSPAPESLMRSPTEDAVAAYARQLAGVMDARTAELGRRAAVDAPAWATKHLGDIPFAGTTDRETWEQRAGAVAAYREQYLTDGPLDLADPIGRAPSESRTPQKHADWQIAARALNLGAEVVVDVGVMTTEELTAVVQTWTDVAASAPRHVADDVLASTRRQQRALARSFEVQSQRASSPGPRLVALGEQLDALTESVEALAADQEVRARWYEDTTDVRAAAQEAREELARRLPASDVPEVSVAEEQTAMQALRRQKPGLSRNMGLGL